MCVGYVMLGFLSGMWRCTFYRVCDVALFIGYVTLRFLDTVPMLMIFIGYYSNLITVDS